MAVMRTLKLIPSREEVHWGILNRRQTIWDNLVLKAFFGLQVCQSRKMGTSRGRDSLSNRVGWVGARVGEEGKGRR